MSVEAAPGSVAVPAANGTGSVLCPWDAPEVVNLNPSPPSGTNRIDLIVCQANGQDIDGGTVDAFVITFTAGAEAPAGSEAPPAVPAGAVALARVKINGGAAAIVAADITDTRPGGLAVPLAPPVSYPRGLLTQIKGPPAVVNAGSTPITVETASAPMVAGRWYKATLQSLLTKVTNAGGTTRNSLVCANDGTSMWVVYQTATTVGMWWAHTTTHWYKAPADGTVTFRFDIACDNASIQAPANGCVLSIEDVGTGP
jgi:hypothetical protein